jgi:acyl carrier protein
VIKSDEIKKVIVSELEKYGPIESEKIDEYNFFAKGHLDSLNIMIFILTLESEFSVNFDEGELSGDGFETIGNLAKLIEVKSR